MKIIAIDDNYRSDKKPKKGDAPISDISMSLMADSSVIKDGKPFFLPEFDPEFKMYPTLAVKICRLGKNISTKFASRYIDSFAIGLNIRACRLRQRLISAGKSPDAAIAFDGASILGDFHPSNNPENLNFEIIKNGETCFTWQNKNLINTIEECIEKISTNFTLKIGDIFFVGIPEDGITINIGDKIVGQFEGQKESLNFNIK
jgi:2-keto-4-pentenoate hydratase/2-oxohepta-3-ene-1,7-dioic acid hydratase in catechol pathway